MFPAPRAAVHATTTPNGDGTLSACGLYKRFGRRVILNGISFTVRQGQALGLLGPNGAGKTTCFYIISGLTRPDRGQVLLDGADITALPLYRRARLGIGYLPQETSIFRGLTTAQNILAVLEIVEPNRAARSARLEALLEEFAITHLRDSPATALSGGERRRLEIARALATDPRFILLDEPLAGVDPLAVREIRALVGHLKQRGIGVLITDHNVRDTLSLVDQVCLLHEGALVAQGAPEEIVVNSDVRRVYLGEDFHLNPKGAESAPLSTPKPQRSAR